jgi:hypothetical protein
LKGAGGCRVQPAKRLEIVLITYGNLARPPFNEQTSGIYNLMQERTKMDIEYRIITGRINALVFEGEPATVVSTIKCRQTTNISSLT